MMRTYTIGVEKKEEAWEIFRELRYVPYTSMLGSKTTVFGLYCNWVMDLYFKYRIWRLARV